MTHDSRKTRHLSTSLTFIIYHRRKPVQQSFSPSMFNYILDSIAYIVVFFFVCHLRSIAIVAYRTHCIGQQSVLCLALLSCSLCTFQFACYTVVLFWANEGRKEGRNLRFFHNMLFAVCAARKICGSLAVNRPVLATCLIDRHDPGLIQQRRQPAAV